MNIWRLGTVSFFVMFAAIVADAESLLVPAHFPKTVADTSFVDRMENEAEGYKPYEGLSAYQIIEFESIEDEAQRAIELELKAAGISDEDFGEITQAMIYEQPVAAGQVGVSNQQAVLNQPVVSSQPVAYSQPASGYCARRNPNIPTGQQVPFGLPVNMDDLNQGGLSSRAQSIARNTNRGLFCSPYMCRPVAQNSSKTRPHEGVDIGCDAAFYQMPIYATADGVVEHIIHAGNNSSAGNYIRLKHNGGWVTQYMHLDQMFVSKGQYVNAGCMIGLMGYTGGNSDQKKRSMSKDLTHLHYEIVYSGNQTQVVAPNGRNVQIVRGNTCTNGKNFKKKVNPAKIMVYQ